MSIPPVSSNGEANGELSSLPHFVGATVRYEFIQVPCLVKDPATGFVHQEWKMVLDAMVKLTTT